MVRDTVLSNDQAQHTPHKYRIDAHLHRHMEYNHTGAYPLSNVYLRAAVTQTRRRLQSLGCILKIKVFCIHWNNALNHLNSRYHCFVLVLPQRSTGTNDLREM